MPIVPNFIERLVLFGLNQGPAPMLDFFGALAFRATCVAIKLGVFEALSRGPLTPGEIARRIKADEQGTTLLLEALDSLGYVKKKGGRYANTSMAAKWLLQSSPSTLADGFRFFDSWATEQWEHLEESIAQGKPAVPFYEWLAERPGGWQEYEAGMIAVARPVADEVAARVKLPAAARQLLDVGGGHGLYAIKLCRRYRRLSATVFDLPEALEVTRKVIAAEEMGDRVSVRAGDFWVDNLGSGHDVALLFNIVNSYPPERSTELLRKVAGALNPGGLLVILDQFKGAARGPTAKVVAGLMALSLFNGLGGRAYEFGEIARWLRAAGFGNPRRLNLFRTPGQSLVLATKAQ